MFRENYLRNFIKQAISQEKVEKAYNNTLAENQKEFRRLMAEDISNYNHSHNSQWSGTDEYTAVLKHKLENNDKQRQQIHQRASRAFYKAQTLPHERKMKEWDMERQIRDSAQTSKPKINATPPAEPHLNLNPEIESKFKPSFF